MIKGKRTHHQTSPVKKEFIIAAPRKNSPINDIVDEYYPILIKRNRRVIIIHDITVYVTIGKYP